ncbi:hypothetical protein SpCBS45565_g04347 [Spizellomyces sp. 'palustris']|nr:hypothetical protein SpCBS45565_g04347 [Spizellomyces sp. 'palustris']
MSQMQTCFPPTTKITASDDVPSITSQTARTLHILPDNIRLPSITPSDLPTLAKTLENLQTTRNSEPVASKYQILVCIHGERDCRCGTKGGRLISSLRAEVDKKGLTHLVDVKGVSHIGGHKYAGNAIVYPTGDWYAHLDDQDASTLLSSVLSNQPLWSKWRGRMGLDKKEQIALYQQSTGTCQPPTQTDQIDVTYLLPDRSTCTLSVPIGKRLMDVGKENEMPSIEGTCGGNLECATCHVIVDPAYEDKLPPVTDEEEDMLEYAIGRTKHSRLSCQIYATPFLNGLRLQIPTMTPRPFPPRGTSIRTYTTKRSYSTQPRDFKSLTREYGPIAVGVYLSLSFLTFCACLTAITAFGIDEAQIKGWFDKFRSMVGFPPSPTPTNPDTEPNTETNDKTYLPTIFQNPTTRQTLTTILLAMAMTKLFLPIKLGITAAITPFVAKKLRNLGFELGTKGGYKSAAVRVKSEVRERTEMVKSGVRDRVRRRDKERD